MSNARTIRRLLAWQPVHNPPTADDVLQGRAWYAKKGQPIEAALMRPEDVQALGMKKVDDLLVEADGCVTPGLIFYAVGE